MLPKASKKNNFHYNKALQPLANENRKNMTKSAACIWKYVLRSGQMQGYTFRRERPILNYIVDFVSLELLLIIEVDGITHQNELQQKKDKIRNEELKKVGFITLRFSSWEVLNRIEQVRYTIEQWIKHQK